MTKKILCLLIICSLTCFFQSYGQVGIGYARLKDFKALGFNTFLNFSLPVSESNYVTLEGGLQYFKNSYDEELAYIPILVGYKYTLNQTGTGFYIEPHAGYAFGESTIQTYDEYGIISDGNGNLIYQKVKGPMAGLGFGYFIAPETSRMRMNIEIRYQHSFAKDPGDAIFLRVTRAFSFKKKNE
jgi:hypothetical protein